MLPLPSSTASLTGDTGAFFNLPGGPVGFAVGVEYRKETSFYDPSELTKTGALIDNSTGDTSRGSFNVKEAFGEVNLPILEDVPLAYALSLGGAIRL